LKHNEGFSKSKYCNFFLIFFFTVQIDFGKRIVEGIAIWFLRVARGIVISYQSSMDSPTAVGKGANERYGELAPFSTAGSP
jgi:hypothetical protein